MENNDVEQEVSRKNAAAIQQWLKSLNDRFNQQHDLILHLQAAITSLTEKVNTLERNLVIQKAIFTGHGLSVKE